jgi:SAM-dependent methyltransferase
MNTEELKAKLTDYRWYHRIEVAPGVFTESVVPHFNEMWEFNFRCLEEVSFEGKRVLDIGCRDGLFSFHAEKQGASEVVGIDNDLSPGAVELLIPHFNSKVRMEEHNLYYLPESYHGHFDIVMCLGVLYHLRYPFWGLKKMLDCLKDGGLLILETGMLGDPEYDKHELLCCPVENSPYGEPTSCTFFNQMAIETTLRSMRCRVREANQLWPFGQSNPREMPGPGVWQKLKSQFKQFLLGKDYLKQPRVPRVCRGLFICQKDLSLGQGDKQITEMGEFDREWRESYWEGKHVEHSRKNTP